MAAIRRESVPLSHAQLLAAGRLFRALPHWSATDRALTALGQAFPGKDVTSVLLKVVAVNSLYFTNIYALNRMAEHVCSVIAEVDLETADTGLVDRIALLPPVPPREKGRKNVSFASKYAHFFIDSARFPIYDKYARAMMRIHLGRAGSLYGNQPYTEYVADFQRLATRAQWTGEPRLIDRYLWLAGLCRAWQDGDDKINREVRDLFAGPTDEQRSDLEVLKGVLGA